MDQQLLQVFTHEIERQCRFAVMANRDLQTALSSDDHPGAGTSSTRAFSRRVRVPGSIQKISSAISIRKRQR